MKNLKDQKIALVHDFLVNYGGAERVLEMLMEMFPEAPIYTLLYDKEKMRGKFSNKEIRTSFLQKFPKFLRKRHRWLLPFCAVAPETFDLRDFDLVISSSGAWSKGIVTKLRTIHVAYIHSPMRFVWDYNEKYLREVRKKRSGFWVRLVLSYLRIWDKMAAERPDFLLANSAYTQKRIKKYYRRESEVIYPPVFWKNELEMADGEKRKDLSEKYFLTVSRLTENKKIDAIVKAFNKLGLPLVVVGEGREEESLKSIAEKNITFLGWQNESELQKIYAGSRAFVFASLDDFGMAPVEAMSFGVPVIALREGGALETVQEGKTGEFFDAATPEVIADGVRRFSENEKEKAYDKEYIKSQADRFGKDKFMTELHKFLENIEV